MQYLLHYSIVRPPYISNGRSYVLLLMSFFSARDLRAPSADRRQTLPRNRKLAEFYNLGPKIPKNWGQNVQNLASSDFDRKSLRNGAIFRKSERHNVIDGNPPRSGKKTSEL